MAPIATKFIEFYNLLFLYFFQFFLLVYVSFRRACHILISRINIAVFSHERKRNDFVTSFIVIHMEFKLIFFMSSILSSELILREQFISKIRIVLK